MPSPSEADQFRADLDALAALAATDVDAVWNELNASDLTDREIRASMVEAYPTIVTPYVSAASDVASVWYDDLAPDSDYTAEPADLPSVEDLESTVWRLTRDMVEIDAEAESLAEVEVDADVAEPEVDDEFDPILAALETESQRLVFGGARDTIADNIAAEGVRWARYASATACAFCRLMAIRGAVYASPERAGQVPNPDDPENPLNRFHSRCRCVVVPLREDDEWTPPGYLAAWEAEYEEASRHGRSNVLPLMRSLDRRGVGLDGDERAAVIKAAAGEQSDRLVERRKREAERLAAAREARRAARSRTKGRR